MVVKMNNNKKKALEVLGENMVKSFSKNSMFDDACVFTQILRARDALKEGNNELAYWHLHAIADPIFQRIDPWAELENLASECGSYRQATSIDNMCECGSSISSQEWEMFGGKCEECAQEDN